MLRYSSSYANLALLENQSFTLNPHPDQTKVQNLLSTQEEPYRVVTFPFMPFLTICLQFQLKLPQIWEYAISL